MEEPPCAHPSTILTEEGYVVGEAGDGVDALDIPRSAGADVVLAGLRMQRMDGRTLLREVRESAIDAVFVVMTAFGSTIAPLPEPLRRGCASKRTISSSVAS
ncbi:MAG TPA: response regulator [Myxococcaceae bacterium]|nr:response regulator [Myxococcaceae bacterium]